MFHVRFDADEFYIDAARIQTKKIQLRSMGENVTIEIRIKYAGYENWTDWISSSAKQVIFI